MLIRYKLALVSYLQVLLLSKVRNKYLCRSGS